MTYLLDYAIRFWREGSPILLCLLPLYGLWRLSVLCPSDSTGRLMLPVDAVQEWRRLLLFGYLVLLFTQTFADYGTESELRLVPFQMIVTQAIESVRSVSGYRAFLFNILGNVAVFVPVGWLVAALTQGHFRRTVLTGFGISLFIEVMQLPLNRTTDVDDLILNTTGAVIGWGCWRMVHSVCAYARRKQSRRSAEG